jgi:hypothetical protein
MRLGSDPEVFLQDQSGKHISVIGMIGADKWNPKQVPDMPEGFTLQEDNVSLEFGIPPARDAEEFANNIELVLKAGLSNVNGLQFSKLSCTIFPEDQLAHPMASVFGCEPDFNAWTGLENPRPTPPHKGMRSAGGHVHIETKEDPRVVVQNCDVHLGLASVLLDDGIERKKVGYGAAGAFRPKPYGVEYRTLSNFWIFSPKFSKWIWRATERALGNLRTFNNTESEYIQKAINTGNRRIASELIEYFQVLMP